jgi:phage terminase small subunit
MKKKMTKQQTLFTKEYLVDLNATQSAIRAGYSKKTARSQGQRLLTNVDIQELIQEETRKKFNEVDLTAKKVLDEIIKLAFANIKNIYDEKGNLLPVHELSDDVAACIQEISQDEKGNSRDDAIVIKRKYKLSDKKSNLEMLARYFKLLTDKHEHSGPNGGSIDYSNLTDEELDRRINELQDKR